MGRTVGNADKLLIAAAMKIATEEGVSGLRIRDVARNAGVNLGMFHYHFRSKKRFTRVLLQEMYEEFFAQLTVASREGPDSYALLRNSLLTMGLFIRDRRDLVGALMKDILNGDPEVLAFARKNVPRHAAVLQSLLAKCQKEGLLPTLPFTQAMSFIMSSMNFPSLLAGYLEKSGVVDPKDLKSILSDQAIFQRVDMALGGMKGLKI